MITPTTQPQTRPLSMTHVNFPGLYTRHLGRHSQFGINVNHLLALYLIWFGIYETLAQVALLLGAPAWWVVVPPALAYLIAVGFNATIRATLATAAFLVLFVASVLAVPRLPAWSIPAFLGLVPIGYKIQTWGHRIWTTAADMSEFNKRFPPGRELNFILLIYEVPICLQYLIFRRADWRR
ncbi:hypothetical protein [Aquisphaera insulae]|uniref:hypothetical protein n=1 Tax=Aquisphaera insulae TaxID=2712864 RepID=UPI002030D6A5|nr:hypothetical protein [Aquisphaera insulae]